MQKDDTDIAKTEEETDRPSVLVGQIAGVYGIKGWIKVKSFTRPMENIAKYKTWHLSSRKGLFQKRLIECKLHGKGLIAKLDGIPDRDQALALQGSDIYIHRSQLPELEDGEYYWQDLIGLKVIDQDEKELGLVKEILETGANDVFVVKGQSRHLIPWVKDIYIKEINPAEGIIRVDWQEDDER